MSSPRHSYESNVERYQVLYDLVNRAIQDAAYRMELYSKQAESKESLSDQSAVLRQVQGHYKNLFVIRQKIELMANSLPKHEERDITEIIDSLYSFLNASYSQIQHLLKDEPYDSVSGWADPQWRQARTQARVTNIDNQIEFKDYSVDIDAKQPEDFNGLKDRKEYVKTQLTVLYEDLKYNLNRIYSIASLNANLDDQLKRDLEVNLLFLTNLQSHTHKDQYTLEELQRVIHTVYRPIFYVELPVYLHVAMNGRDEQQALVESNILSKKLYKPTNSLIKSSKLNMNHMFSQLSLEGDGTKRKHVAIDILDSDSDSNSNTEEEKGDGSTTEEEQPAVVVNNNNNNITIKTLSNSSLPALEKDPAAVVVPKKIRKNKQNKQKQQSTRKRDDLDEEDQEEIRPDFAEDVDAKDLRNLDEASDDETTMMAFTPAVIQDIGVIDYPVTVDMVLRLWKQSAPLKQFQSTNSSRYSLQSFDFLKDLDMNLSTAQTMVRDLYFVFKAIPNLFEPEEETKDRQALIGDFKLLNQLMYQLLIYLSNQPKSTTLGSLKVFQQKVSKEQSVMTVASFTENLYTDILEIRKAIVLLEKWEKALPELRKSILIALDLIVANPKSSKATRLQAYAPSRIHNVRKKYRALKLYNMHWYENKGFDDEDEKNHDHNYSHDLQAINLVHTPQFKTEQVSYDSEYSSVIEPYWTNDLGIPMNQVYISYQALYLKVGFNELFNILDGDYTALAEQVQATVIANGDELLYHYSFDYWNDVAYDLSLLIDTWEQIRRTIPFSADRLALEHYQVFIRATVNDINRARLLIQINSKVAKQGNTIKTNKSSQQLNLQRLQKIDTRNAIANMVFRRLAWVLLPRLQKELKLVRQIRISNPAHYPRSLQELMVDSAIVKVEARQKQQEILIKSLLGNNPIAKEEIHIDDAEDATEEETRRIIDLTLLPADVILSQFDPLILGLLSNTFQVALDEVHPRIIQQQANNQVMDEFFNGECNGQLKTNLAVPIVNLQHFQAFRDTFTQIQEAWRFLIERKNKSILNRLERLVGWNEQTLRISNNDLVELVKEFNVLQISVKNYQDLQTVLLERFVQPFQEQVNILQYAQLFNQPVKLDKKFQSTYDQFRNRAEDSKIVVKQEVAVKPEPEFVDDEPNMANQTNPRQALFDSMYLMKSIHDLVKLKELVLDTLIQRITLSAPKSKELITLNQIVQEIGNVRHLSHSDHISNPSQFYQDNVMPIVKKLKALQKPKAVQGKTKEKIVKVLHKHWAVFEQIRERFQQKLIEKYTHPSAELITWPFLYSYVFGEVFDDAVNTVNNKNNQEIEDEEDPTESKEMVTEDADAGLDEDEDEDYEDMVIDIDLEDLEENYASVESLSTLPRLYFDDRKSPVPNNNLRPVTSAASSTPVKKPRKTQQSQAIKDVKNALRMLKREQKTLADAKKASNAKNTLTNETLQQYTHELIKTTEQRIAELSIAIDRLKAQHDITEEMLKPGTRNTNKKAKLSPELDSIPASNNNNNTLPLIKRKIPKLTAINPVKPIVGPPRPVVAKSSNNDPFGLSNNNNNNINSPFLISQQKKVNDIISQGLNLTTKVKTEPQSMIEAKFRFPLRMKPSAPKYSAKPTNLKGRKAWNQVVLPKRKPKAPLRYVLVENENIEEEKQEETVPTRDFHDEYYQDEEEWFHAERLLDSSINNERSKRTHVYNMDTLSSQFRQIRDYYDNNLTPAQQSQFELFEEHYQDALAWMSLLKERILSQSISEEERRTSWNKIRFAKQKIIHALVLTRAPRLLALQGKLTKLSNQYDQSEAAQARDPGFPAMTNHIQSQFCKATSRLFEALVNPNNGNAELKAMDELAECKSNVENYINNRNELFQF